jgi:hypothetical protein
MQGIFSTNAVLGQHDRGIGPNNGVKLFCKGWLGVQKRFVGAKN